MQGERIKTTRTASLEKRIRGKNGGLSKRSAKEHPLAASAPQVLETSSDPLPIPAAQKKLFREVLTLFEARCIPFAVAGAFALQAHTGICRDTKDLDLFLTSRNAPIALDYLEREGFDCEVCDPVWLFKVRRNRFFVDLITGMSNAAISVEDSWIQRAKASVIHGVATRILAPEELLVSKLFVTRRERFDGADIAHIIYATRGKLDWPRVFSLAGEHWELLFWALVFFRYAYPAQTNFVPYEVWRDLMERFQNAILHHNAAARFRGSLIDDKMFAIDVREWGLENLYLDLRNRRLREIPELP